MSRRVVWCTLRRRSTITCLVHNTMVVRAVTAYCPSCFVSMHSCTRTTTASETQPFDRKTLQIAVAVCGARTIYKNNNNNHRRRRVVALSAARSAFKVFQSPRRRVRFNIGISVFIPGCFLFSIIVIIIYNFIVTLCL